MLTMRVLGEMFLLGVKTHDQLQSSPPLRPFGTVLMRGHRLHVDPHVRKHPIPDDFMLCLLLNKSSIKESNWEVLKPKV